VRIRALAALLLLTGCSIPATGAVHSGGPATGVHPGTRLYFPGARGIELTIRPGGRAGLQQTMDTLLAGPDLADSQAGRYSDLPAAGRVEATTTPGVVTLRLSWDTAHLTYTVQQLVCTAEDAPVPGPPPRIDLLASDANAPIQQQCVLHRSD
jgi:hypothetical protein